ncbi:lengsin [Biomphalaria pfeifferi]|uniref:Lengsin n=1 Tax=Biomphalaria pfeifferi TaxID=112525 RepID=A0AAD8BZB4_BIOPF|nr:lengsin [Biomphalaria pfeifferi]
MAATVSGFTQVRHELDEFDLVLFTAPDMHGVARGRFIFKSSLKGFVKNGLGIAQASLFSGVQCDIPMVLVEYSQEGWASGTLIPDISTLRPLSYLSYGDKKVGQLICDYQSFTGEREISMSREVALNQLQELRNLGLDISVAFELEFSIFKKGTLLPVSLNENLDILLNKLLTTLSESGIPVISVGRGTEAGIEAADSLHRLRNILRSVCVSSGYDITYMTKPLPGFTKNRFHFIMTLFDEQESNILTNSNTDDSIGKLSEVGQHWAAGLLNYHSALTALFRPTINCYSFGTEDIEISATWTCNENLNTARLHIGSTTKGTCIRDSLPTSACNPYIALGGLLTAGMAGISNKMLLPLEMSAEEEVQHSLPEALDSLEKDAVFVNALGSKFVHRYIALKREYEIEKFKDKKDVDLFENERSIYLHYL